MKIEIERSAEDVARGIMMKTFHRHQAGEVRILRIVNLIATVDVREALTSRITVITMIHTALIISNNNTLKCCEELILKLTSGIKIITE